MNIKRVLGVCLFLWLLVPLDAGADIYYYQATDPTGGSATAMDEIDGAGLNDKDAAYVVMDSHDVCIYILDDDANQADSAESPCPRYVRPDSNAGTKSWVLLDVNGWKLNSVSGVLAVTGIDAATVPFTITGAAGQAADLFVVELDGGTNVVEINSTGHISNIDGMRTVSVEYGAAFGTNVFGTNTPDHTNQAGWYDHTGGAQEQLFTKTSGDDFTQADADDGSHLLFTSGAQSLSMCEVEQYISTTTVVAKGFGWDGDINSGGSPGNFLTLKHPGFITGAGYQHEFSVDGDGEFEIDSYSFTGDKVSEIHVDAAADVIDGLVIEADANGYNVVVGLDIHYNSGALAAGEIGGGLFVAIDESLAVASDATTIIGGATFSTTNVNSATTRAIVVLPGFADAVRVIGAPEEAIAYGYEVDASGPTVTDRVNSAGAGNDAFDNVAVDETIFDDVNDYILVGSDNTFEIVDVNLDTISSKNIVPTFYYSAGAGVWTAFSVLADATGGMTASGSILFTAPGGWAKDDEAESNGDITNAYYIKIVRTYAPPIVNEPIENIFKTFANQTAGMAIKGNGIIGSSYRAGAPGSPANGDIWMEADGLHVYYNGAEQVLTP